MARWVASVVPAEGLAVKACMAGQDGAETVAAPVQARAAVGTAVGMVVALAVMAAWEVATVAMMQVHVCRPLTTSHLGRTSNQESN